MQEAPFVVAPGAWGRELHRVSVLSRPGEASRRRAKVRQNPCRTVLAAVAFGGISAALAPSSGADAQELVTNGGFESSFTGWSQTNAFSGGSTGIRSPVHSGSIGASLPNSGTSVASISQNIVLGSSIYTLSFWYRPQVNVTGRNTTFSATLGGQSALSTTIDASSPTTFQQVTKNITIGTAGSTSLLFTTTPTINAGVFVSIDDVSLIVCLTSCTVAPSTLAPSLPSGAPTNVSNVAAAIDANGNGSSTAGFSTLYGLTGAALANAMQQLSGETNAGGGVQGSTQLTNSFLSLLLNGFVGNRATGGGFGPAIGYAQEPRLSAEASNAYAALNRASGAPAQDSFNSRWNAWGSVYGGQANASGNTGTGSNDTRAQAFGFAVGMDRRLQPDLTVGFALAGGGTRWSVSNGFGGGSSEVLQVGAYGTKQFGASYVSAAAAYSANWM